MITKEEKYRMFFNIFTSAPKLPPLDVQLLYFTREELREFLPRVIEYLQKDEEEEQERPKKDFPF